MGDSLSPSLFFSLCLSLSLCLFLSRISLPIYPFSLFLTVLSPLSVFLILALSFFLSLLISHLSLCLSVSFYLVPMSLYITSLSFCQSVSSLPLLSLSLYLSLSLSLYVCLSLSPTFFLASFPLSKARKRLLGS